MLALTFALVFADEIESASPALLKVDPGLAIWMAFTFLLVLLILRRFAWPSITSALSSRETKIQESMNRAEKALEEAKQIQADNQKARREAEQEAQQILRQARETAERLRTEELDKTKAIIQQTQEQAQAEIEREKLSALQELRSEVSALAIQAAGKIIDENLNDDRQRRLVDKFIDDLAQN